MKKKKIRSLCIGFVCILLIVAIGVISVVTSKTPDPRYGVEGSITAYDGEGSLTEQVKSATAPILVASAENRELYIDSGCNITYKNKATGKTYSTLVSQDKRGAFVDTPENMESICSLSYLAADGTEQTMNAAADAVGKGQFSVDKIENGISVGLMFGQASEKNLVPYAVDKSRFEKNVLQKLEKDDSEFVLRIYTLYDGKTVADYGAEELLTTIPELANKQFYVKNKVGSNVTKKKLEKIFEKIGYTEEDIAEDNRISGYKGDEVTPCFKLEMRLTLEDGSLKLNIPAGSVECYKEYPLMTLTPLKYFISEAGMTGGVLIPSGSGAISEFCPGSRAGSYKARFYGDDDNRTTDGITTDMELYDDNLSLPIYAMQTGNEYIAAQIESSAESATFNYLRQRNSALCSTEFTVVQSDRSYISNKKSTVVFALDKNDTDITVRYTMGSSSVSEDVDYSAIACLYRERLTENGTLPKNGGKVSMLVEFVGAVKCDTEILGLVNTRGLLELTSFDEMKKMASEISGATDTGEFHVKISGWNKEGLFASAPGSFKPAAVLGGKKDLKKLTSFLKGKAKSVFFEENHAYVYDYTSATGYKKSNFVRLIDNNVGLINGYNPVDGLPDKSVIGSYIVSPIHYSEIASKNIKNGLSGVSVGRFATVLNSDYNQNSNVLRSTAKKSVMDSLEKYCKANVPVLSNDCNDYALKYLSLVENMPDSPSVDNKLLDRAVPFKQMVLHGSVSYTGTAVNMATDHKKALLHAIETGSGIFYTFTAHPDEKLTGTDFSFLYYTDYKLTGEEAKESWKTVQQALKGLENIPMISHSISGDVATVKYENGTVICVNYSQNPVNTPYGTVEAQSYGRFNG